MQDRRLCQVAIEQNELRLYYLGLNTDPADDVMKCSAVKLLSIIKIQQILQNSLPATVTPNHCHHKVNFKSQRRVYI